MLANTFTFALVVIMLIAIQYYLYKIYKRRQSKDNTVVLLKDESSAKVQYSRTCVPSSYHRVITFTMRINDYVYMYNQMKPIIYIGKDPKTLANPNVLVYLHPTQNAIIVKTENLDKSSVASNVNIKETFYTSPNDCIVYDIPLQKYVTITVELEDNTVNVFVNGKMKSSCYTGGIIPLSQDTIYICPNGGFDGTISNVTIKG